MISGVAGSAGVEFLILFPSLYVVQGPADDVQQPLHVNRLRHIPITSGLERALPGDGQSIRRERKHGDRTGGRIRFQDAGCLPAVQLRQTQIHENQIGLLQTGCIHSVPSIDRKEDFVTCTLQYEPYELVVVHVILDDQDAALAHGKINYTASQSSGQSGRTRENTEKLFHTGWMGKSHIMVGVHANNDDTMRILFVADGRSPIAQNWIRHFASRNDEVHLVSTFSCSVDFPLASLQIIPVAFSGLRRGGRPAGSAPSRTLGLRTTLRHWFGPLTIRPAAQRLRDLIADVKPDLIHAMRIPYEGMLAADASLGRPLLISTWGNDFTLHAPSTRLMSHYTRWTMQVADALHTDCQRDLRLAGEWGFGVHKPGLVIPGNGGVRTDVFFPPAEHVQEPVIINPRGFRPYVRNEVFFKAIPLVLRSRPNARFIFAAMAGEPQAEEWLHDLNIAHAVELLRPLPHIQMAEVFRRAQIVASPSVHDGTPNSLLEGMACGCFPVAGDLESVREWITPEVNGLLFDPNDPEDTASALVRAIEDSQLRHKGEIMNQDLIESRAEYGRNMQRAEGFYELVRRGG